MLNEEDIQIMLNSWIDKNSVTKYINDMIYKFKYHSFFKF